VVFTGIVEFAGDTSIELRVAAVMLTEMVAAAVKPPELAETVADPPVRPVATPDGLTDTSLVLLEDQLTEFVRFWVEPSEYVPVAVSVTDAPGASVMVVGTTARPVSVGEPV
jgi:hypothetical protein